MNDALFNGDRRILLHVGCGPEGKEALPPLDFTTQWREIRVDLDPSVQPDIVASITDLAGVPDESVSMVFSKHNLEHVEGYQVPLVLGAFFRVLRPDGFAVILTPDLAAVAKLILSKGLEAAGLYHTAKGRDIAPIDILYGSRTHIAQGMGFMAHRTGFTGETLRRHLTQAGFETVQLNIRPLCELGAIALKVQAGNVYSNLTGSRIGKNTGPGVL